MIHWAEPGQRSLCTADGETSYDEESVTCGECLYHLINQHFETYEVPLAKLREILALLDS